MRAQQISQEVAPGVAAEQPFEDSGPGSGPPDALVLDIGGDFGALILYADETCLGAEIDLTPAGAPRSHHMHTMVRRRRATKKDIFAGLYPELVEGTYTIWGRGDSGPIGEVTIVGGQVTEFHGGGCRPPGPGSGAGGDEKGGRSFAQSEETGEAPNTHIPIPGRPTAGANAVSSKEKISYDS